MTEPSATLILEAAFSPAQDIPGRVREYIVSHSLIEDGATVMLGVSGGVDSMTLLYVLQFIGYRVRVLHINYGLRDKEADKDAALVRSYCGTEGIMFTEIAVRGEMSRRPAGASIQAHARSIRYRHFADIAGREGIRYVAVAHHMDDQAETLLMNLQRQTGFGGLVGMRPTRPIEYASHIRLVRPFLCARRREIERFAVEHRIRWREDASNASLDFLRGRIRHQILPALLEEGKVDFIPEFAGFAEGMVDFVDNVLPGLMPAGLRLDELNDQWGRLPVDLLVDLPESVRNWLLLRAVRKWIPEAPLRKSTVAAIEELMESQVGRRVEYATGSVWRERNALKFVSDADDRVGPDVIPLEIEGQAETPGGIVVAERLQGPAVNFETPPEEILADEEKLTGSLSIRAWKAGDRFQPFGMSGTKKVKSFLTDEKVPPSRRSSIRVLCEGSNIVWVLGYRMDDRYRVDEMTKQIVRFRLVDVPPRKE